MTHLTRALIATVLNALLHQRGSSRFTGHEAQKRCLGMHPRETALEILEYQNDPTMSALQKFSMQFDRYIDRTFSGQIRQTTKVLGENICGDQSESQEWEIAVPGSPVA
jgi:hypothetical protein